MSLCLASSIGWFVAHPDNRSVVPFFPESRYDEWEREEFEKDLLEAMGPERFEETRARIDSVLNGDNVGEVPGIQPQELRGRP